MIKDFKFEVEKKTRVIHTRNPYIIKNENLKPKKIKGNILDGYFALIISGCELPDEVININICNEKLTDTDLNELSYFEFLTIIKADHNFLNLHHFVSLKNLKSLSLMENKINILPNLEGILINLEKLDLSFNSIQNFTNLKSLKNLKKLSLAGNNIEKFDIEFDKENKLEEIDLSFNKLTNRKNEKLWELLSNLKLKILKLNNNEFETINESEVIMKNFTLYNLDLSSNKLNNEEGLLCLLKMQNLKVLKLENNSDLKNPLILVKQLKRKFNCNVIVSKIENNFQKKQQKKYIKVNYKTIDICEIKKENLQGEYFKNKKDFFGIVLDLQKKKKNLMSYLNKNFDLKNDFNNEKNVFLTNLNENQDLKKKKKLENYFDSDSISNKELMIIANVLLKDYKQPQKYPLTHSYRMLNSYFLT